jgi:MoaE-MoaD fusion protein
MRVRVLFFGMLKELSGKSSEELELPEGAAVQAVLDLYSANVPQMSQVRASLAVSVNQEYATSTTELKDGDEIGLLPPVSGGTAGNAPKAHRYSDLVRDPIDTLGVLERIKQGEDGAAVLFEGVVRNHTRGRKTLYLNYEAYEEMALRQMEAMAERAMQDFKIREVALVHRLGKLEIGETSVLIVVASAHRAAAFDACRWLIDTLKRTVPIWKKEHFEDGAVWADGEPFPDEIPRAGSPGAEGASK